MRHAHGFLAAVLAAAVATFAVGCGKKDGNAGPLERAARQADKAVQKAVEVADDAAILAKVKTKLVADAVAKALHVDVDVKDGVVTLKGTADTQEQVDTAAKIAEDTAGVKSVKVEIEVKK
jgi:hyperosmotically inducible protein